MTDMQAALGLCQLRELDWILERRRVLAERYNEALDRVPHIQTPHDPPYAQRTWQSYCVRIAPGAPLGRTDMMRSLLHDGIATRRGVMAIHEEASYARESGLGRGTALPHTEAATRETMMLPLFPDLTEAQQDRVIDSLAEALHVRAA